MKSWYQVENSAANGKTKAYIFDEIGYWGVTAKEFLDEIKGAGDIDLHINSVGGSVFDALAMYHTLKQHDGVVDVYIDGMAASSASIVAMAGRTIYMPKNAFMMIHDPIVAARGTSNDIKTALDLVSKAKEILINIYETRSRLPRAVIEKAMSDTTWYTGTEAKEAGFIDVVTDAIQLAASFNVADFKNVPSEIVARFGKKSANPDLKEFESHLRDAFGFSKTEACAVASYGLRALHRGDRGKETAAMLKSAAKAINSL
ncbi:MAG: Clp protease ClpP [Burkholderiales bacterium]|jgi:ATP-dependent protease ClpP protease subunit|nr:Clp protease ClpP [Burkholderiales bacterium]